MSSPGSKVDSAVTVLFSVAGRLLMMVAKKNLSRAALVRCIDDLAEALELLRSVK